ncbi:ABC transporter ATP-binding protein [Haploplasma axanthum]|uniref:ABC-type multidrug/protein/lipid transport system ATPase component n=1 Tax=Haploplasma axanthum TaxID=29552 RepID=A0A449BF34_HAPAX|nr:ABC transporter ATP-binding protein [Haploplasma axanthum]VEU81046.1 ABC-type multidrug/protein/lipid transport system ATPase component [Haploplasma axanthum]
MQRFKELFKLVKGNWGLFIFVVILAIFHRLTYSYVPLFSELLLQKLELKLKPSADLNIVNLPNFILDFVDKNTEIINVVISIIIMMLVWQFVRYLTLYFESRAKGLLSENVAKKSRVNSYDHIQNLSYEYHNNADSGDLIQRVTSDIDTTTSFVSYRIMDAIGLVASLVSGAFQMYYVNETIMWISLAVIPITALSSIIYFTKIDKLFTDVEEKESKLMVVIQENVSASRVVRAFANEKYEIEKLETKNKEYRESEIKASRVVAIYWGFMDFLMMVQFLVVLLFGIHFSRQGTMSVSSISSALMLAGMLIWPVRGLGRIINDFGKSLVAAGRLSAIMNEKSEYENDGVLNPEIHGHIVFKDVNFKFNNTDKYLLENISFEILPGETVAIIGKTGSGKTTIVNLLLKMYDYEGSITIDGVELREIKKRYLRSNIGTVLQDPFLYSKTVYENIAIANPNASKEKIFEASRIAALEKDIKTFQNGYETIVGEQGTTLSGGQKQRVAIARILVTDKPIIIFDDALSALDNKTDLDIRKALKETKNEQTNIIITHRMTTAKEADKIIVINNGTIENIGTHKELSKKAGLYSNLWKIQGKLEEEFLSMLKDGEKNAEL